MPSETDNARLKQLQEENLSKLIKNDLAEQDKQWVEYDVTEAQVKVNVANKLFEYITDETAGMLNRLSIRKPEL